MLLIIHCEVFDDRKGFSKLQWAVYDSNQNTESGDVISDMPTYTFDFVQFLLAMGRCETLIGHNLPGKLKAIGAAMAQNCLRLSVERPEKIIHLDIAGTPGDLKNPSNIDDVYKMFLYVCPSQT